VLVAGVLLHPTTVEPPTRHLPLEPDLDELLLSGAPEDIRRFYEIEFDGVLGYFYRRTLDVDVAADLTSETFARMLENQPSFDPVKGSSRQWLYGIAANQLRDFWRRHRTSRSAQERLAMETLTIDLQTAAELEAVEAAADRGFLHRAVESLSRKYRAAVKLRVMEQLTYEEIGRRMECTPGAARTQVFRGLRQLEDVIDVG
jgi:RNA polymerase sigma factor (sigma-70 family)